MAILFLLLFGPEKLPVVIVEGMRLFRQLRGAAEQATDEIRREFEAAAKEIESAAKELTDAAGEVQAFGAEARKMADDAQREAAGEPSILPPHLAAPPPSPSTEVVSADAAALPDGAAEDLDPALHAIEAMGGDRGARAAEVEAGVEAEAEAEAEEVDA